MSIVLNTNITDPSTRVTNFYSPAHTGDITYIYWLKQPLGLAPTTGNFRSGQLMAVGNDDFALFQFRGVRNRLGTTGASPNLNWTYTAINQQDNISYSAGYFGAIEDQWIMVAHVHYSNATEAYQYIYDSDGVLIDSEMQTQDLNPTDMSTLTLLQPDNASWDFTGTELKIAELSVHTRALFPAQLADIAANQNILTDHTADLKGYWPLTTDWGTTGGVIQDASGNGYNITPGSGWGWSVDTPGLVVTVTNVVDKYNGVSFDATPLADGTIYSVRQAFGTPAPTESQIINGDGPNVLEHVTVPVLSAVTSTVSFTTGTTFTQYEYYTVFEPTAPGDNTVLPGSLPRTTTGLATAVLADVNGTTRPNLANINYAWFDETTGDTLMAPTTTGTTSTDASGNIFVSTNNSILTAGQTGRLDIDAVDGADTYTASYFITVS